MSIDIHALSGAYAVDALDDIERAQFERHIADCASCRAEVDSLREAAALLPETADLTPPDALRELVLAGIQTVRPVPPVVLAAGDRGRSTRRRFPRLVAAAVALIALGGVGGAVVWQSDDDRSGVVEAQRVQDAPDARTYTQEMGDGGSVTIVRSEKLNQAVVTTAGLEPLADDETYELWLIHDGVMVPAGITDGDVSNLLLEGDPRTASGAGITIEPEGGSEEPSLPPIAQLDFKQA
ncbi:anti-sigma factor [Nocardioides litoris]|uniref:anti-sigma factor n=1 Tax=Nocardioides litoris TaxID=1926648 RepID=UPI0011248B00|nr:anti-sigma factor [Nocardioides litoris]